MLTKDNSKNRTMLPRSTSSQSYAKINAIFTKNKPNFANQQIQLLNL